jgi:lysophospholipase L1-like esterase
MADPTRTALRHHPQPARSGHPLTSRPHQAQARNPSGKAGHTGGHTTPTRRITRRPNTKTRKRSPTNERRRIEAQAAKPQPISPRTYSALGDSFAAGFGAGTPINTLGQSAEAYPVVLAGGDNLNLNFLAVAGGTTATVAADQIPLIPHTTKQVTLTVGGNDLGFVPKAMACFNALAACAFSAADLGTLTKSLSSNIAAIHAAAPAATIYVTGYPLLFQADSGLCVAGATPTVPVVISEAQADAMDADAVALNSAIMSAIAGPAPRYANYVDVTVAFTGHGLCGTYASQVPNPVSYINQVPAVNVIAVPLHPTAAGQQAYAASIRAKGFKG